MRKSFFTKIVAFLGIATLVISGTYTTSYAVCNHRWVLDSSFSEKPTCSEAGYNWYDCSICGDSKKVTVPATRIHKWTEWKADGYLCEDGKWERYCTECYKEETKARQGDGSHLWSNWEVWTEADCLNKGQESRYCYNCYQREYKDIPVDDTKHDWSSWSTLWDESVEPTIFKSGKQTRHCYTCSKVEIKKIPKLKATVSISCKSKTLKVGEKLKLKIKKRTYPDVLKSWTTDNKKVAKVNKKGEVSAVKKGKATITLKMKSGCTATCKVTVK